jgi:hypothetical protein
LLDVHVAQDAIDVEEELDVPLGLPDPQDVVGPRSTIGTDLRRKLIAPRLSSAVRGTGVISIIPMNSCT